jgi:hypothetical protein
MYRHRVAKAQLVQDTELAQGAVGPDKQQFELPMCLFGREIVLI